MLAVETLPSLVVMGLVVEMLVMLSVVDSTSVVEVIISVVVERPGRRSHFEA